MLCLKTTGSSSDPSGSSTRAQGRRGRACRALCPTGEPPRPPTPPLQRLLLAREELLDVLAAELGTLHDRMADAGKHFLEPGTDLTLADLLGAPLDPFGCLIHFGLVGGVGRPEGQNHGREEDRKSTRLNSSHITISYAV